jgi:hypothetical protein
MSDEEKKVIDSLKVISEYAGDNYLAKEHRRKLKMLIELVEKQSKEIEELKKEKEKNKKAIDFINDKNNYFEDGENWQNILKIKEILEE